MSSSAPVLGPKSLVSGLTSPPPPVLTYAAVRRCSATRPRRGCRGTGRRTRRPRPSSASIRPGPPTTTSRAGRRCRAACPSRGEAREISAAVAEQLHVEEVRLVDPLTHVVLLAPVDREPESGGQAVPDGRCRSSGSLVRRPTSITRLMSPAISASSLANVCSYTTRRPGRQAPARSVWWNPWAAARPCGAWRRR